MVKRQTTLHAFKKSTLVALVLAALLAACAPAQSPEQIQSQVQTSVALTVQAQNSIGTFVAQTVEAQSGQQTLATPTVTDTPEAVPTLTPVIIPSPTPYAAAPSGGGSGSYSGSSPATGQDYHCSVVGQTPNDNSPATILKTGDKLDVHWTILNDGTKTWEAGSPWGFYSSSIDSDASADANLPITTVGLDSGLGSQVKPGDNVTLGMELTAPSSFASRNPIHITYYYVLILEGSKKVCHPWINVEVIRPGMTP